MSVRAAPARTRDAAPAIALPAKAPFRSLASVLEAGFRKLSLHDGAHTDVKRDRDGNPLPDKPVDDEPVDDYLPDGEPVDDEPADGPLEVAIRNIQVENAEDYGTFIRQTINFSVYHRYAGGYVSPGFPLDGPDTPAVDPKNLVRSGRLVGTFWKKDIGIEPKFDTVVMEFSHMAPFKGIITTTGPRNAKVDLPRELPHKALRRAAQWIKGGTKLQDEDEAAFDLEEFLDMTEVAPMFHHLAEMVFNVYTALFDENQLKQQRNKLLPVGLRWPGSRWSIGDPMDEDDDGLGHPEEDESDGSDEDEGSAKEDDAPEIVPNKMPRM
jgi:hypothetical protein